MNERSPRSDFKDPDIMTPIVFNFVCSLFSDVHRTEISPDEFRRRWKRIGCRGRHSHGYRIQSSNVFPNTRNFLPATHGAREGLILRSSRFDCIDVRTGCICIASRSIIWPILASLLRRTNSAIRRRTIHRTRRPSSHGRQSRVRWRFAILHYYIRTRPVHVMELYYPRPSMHDPI